MAITNQDRVGKAMDLLRAGLAPFVEREFKSQHQAQAAKALLLGTFTRCVIPNWRALLDTLRRPFWVPELVGLSVSRECPHSPSAV